MSFFDVPLTETDLLHTNIPNCKDVLNVSQLCFWSSIVLDCGQKEQKNTFLFSVPDIILLFSLSTAAVTWLLFHANRPTVLLRLVLFWRSGCWTYTLLECNCATVPRPPCCITLTMLTDTTIVLFLSICTGNKSTWFTDPLRLARLVITDGR